jgi:hypothetical protein
MKEKCPLEMRKTPIEYQCGAIARHRRRLYSVQEKERTNNCEVVKFQY